MKARPIVVLSVPVSRVVTRIPSKDKLLAGASPEAFVGMLCPLRSVSESSEQGTRTREVSIYRCSAQSETLLKLGGKSGLHICHSDVAA